VGVAENSGVRSKFQVEVANVAATGNAAVGATNPLRKLQSQKPMKKQGVGRVGDSKQGGGSSQGPGGSKQGGSG
jgi:hypothetical protein